MNRIRLLSSSSSSLSSNLALLVSVHIIILLQLLVVVVQAEPIYNVTLGLWIDPTQCNHKCIPNGICALESKGCYNRYETNNTAAADNTNTSNLLECQFRCACNYGFAGEDCSQEIQPCNGHFPTSIITQYGLDDDLDVVCYNGGKCIAQQEIGGDTTYTCDCSDIDDEISINRGNGGLTTYNGLQCEFSRAISCVKNQQFSNTNYCVNSGICLRYVNSDTDTMLPCQCPAQEYEGRHCQYKYGKAPQSELDYVRTQLLLEEQRIENQENLKKQQQDAENGSSSYSDGSTSGGGGLSTVGIVFMVLFAICISSVGCFYAYRHGLRRHEVTSSNSGASRGSKRASTMNDDGANDDLQFDQAFDITDDDDKNGTASSPGDGKEII